MKPSTKGAGQTGHYPFPIDINEDRRQEILIGYSLWEADGIRHWSHDTALKDHADALSIGNFSPIRGGPMRAYVDGSDEGFPDLRSRRKLLKHLRLGHAQTQSVGRYRPDLQGLQIAVANFWRNPGIVTILDHRRQHPRAGRDDSGIEPSRAGQLARRRAGVRAAIRQRARGA